MKLTYHIPYFLVLVLSFFFFQNNSFGQENLTLRLEAEKTALLEGEQGIFTLILENTSTEEANNISVNFTRSIDFEILEETANTSNGTFSGSWSIDVLQAEGSDTLRFEAKSVGYAFFIAEVTSNSDLLIGRCFSGDCYPDDNIKCFYSNCTPEADEVLYPAEYFQLEFARINCLSTGNIGCGARYNITFENTSNVASAPINLFLRADIGETGVFYQQSGNTLVVPSIPANSTFDFVADFGACIEDRPFASVNGLQLGLTQSNVISLFTTGTQTAPLSAFDALTDIDYCTEVNTTDIAIRAESDGIIYPDNTGNFQVFVTNNGDETAESIQITYGRNIVGGNGLIISYTATSEYPESSLSEDDESEARFLDYDKYWNIRNLAPGETAVLNARVFVQAFVGIFSTTISVNDNSFLNDPNPENNQATIEFQRRNNIDLELSLETDNPNIAQWESGMFTFTLENTGLEDATGVEVRLYYLEDVVPVGRAIVTTSSGTYATRPDAQFNYIGLWKDISVPANSTATLQIQLFSKVAALSFCAEVTKADQEDEDSTPMISGCGAGEDDEVTFSNQGGASCSFFRQYPNVFVNNNPSEIEVTETEDQYILQATFSDIAQTLILDKKGNLLENSTSDLETIPVPRVSALSDNTTLRLVQVNTDGDTLINELITVDYPNPTAVVPNSGVIRVSDGYVFGGFIVDSGSSQTFRGFLVKTDLNGQNAQFIVIEDINDTLSFSSLLEDSQGNLFIFWAGSGNYSLSGTSADFSATWVSQFAGDTPSTDVEDIKISQDEQTIYVAVTGNFRVNVYAYNTETGASTAAGFDLTDWFPLESGCDAYRINGILPLSDGSLLFSNQFFGCQNEERFDYGIFDVAGQLVWSQSIAGEALELRPIAEISDGGFLFASSDGMELNILKTNAMGERMSLCEDFEAGTEIDLELSINSNMEDLPIFTSATFTLTLTNNGPDRATGVEVQLPIDKERFVEVGNSTPSFSVGNYKNGVWKNIELDAGETATLVIELYNKSTDLTIFAQVTQANQRDVDSTPFNGVCCMANEDDEATITISNNARAIEARYGVAEVIQIYPNPTSTILNIKGIQSERLPYQIYDFLGRVVQSGFVDATTISVEELVQGTYYLRLGMEKTSGIRFVKL